MTLNNSIQKLILIVSFANLHNFSKTMLKLDCRKLIRIEENVEGK
jgi:hypothetical protein